MDKKFTVTYPWDENGYKPEVEFTLSRRENGFHLHILAKEKDPRRVETRHERYVHTDSCVEWFVNFLPESCDRYFNLEVNANGAMYGAFRKDRYDFQMLEEADLEAMNISARVLEDCWEVEYDVPFSLICKYVPGYQFEEGMKVRANFYKCGDEMPFPHYGMWHEFYPEKPDFHRPEYFGEITLD